MMTDEQLKAWQRLKRELAVHQGRIYTTALEMDPEVVAACDKQLVSIDDDINTIEEVFI